MKMKEFLQNKRALLSFLIILMAGHSVSVQRPAGKSLRRQGHIRVDSCNSWSFLHVRQAFVCIL